MHLPYRVISVGLFSHLFYPWGFLVQVAALVHAVRRRPETYWYWIIFFGGFLGAGVYIVVEVLPEARLARGMFDGMGRKSRIRQVETAILDNPSAANYEELGDLYWDQKEFARAREEYSRSITVRGNSVHCFYRPAQCAMELGEFAAAVPDFEHVVRADGKYDSYRAAALLAHAYAKTGQSANAETVFAQATQYSTTSETIYNYACFLKSESRLEEAREWAQRILNKKRTLPRHLKPLERPWFRKAEELTKELGPAA